MVAHAALTAALRDAGVPETFSVVPFHQTIPRSILEEIDAFIAVFDRVTTRPAWQRLARESAGAHRAHPEICFFSAWDVHLPPEEPERWRLIELNDNGSGFLFAAIINHAYYRLAGLTAAEAIAPDDIAPQLIGMIEREARAFFGEVISGLFVVLDDAESRAHGHFRAEHRLLRALLERRGWEVAIAQPDELSLRDGRLICADREVRFVINRSTDFTWRADAFAPLWRAWDEGRVYVAPNPFTYATRSDKNTLEPLSLPLRDEELGITPTERIILQRVAETHVVRASNLDMLAEHKDEFFFKPAHGFGSHGVIPSASIGKTRLRRWLRKGEAYVAQRFVPKTQLVLPPGQRLFSDLRVWAYRGTRYLLSGRASAAADRLDLTEGGWVPTFARP